MCDIYDVLESSYGSADEIVSTVYEYGENNLGNGIRKIAGDMLMVGQDLGYNECRDKAVPIAYDLGNRSDNRRQIGLRVSRRMVLHTRGRGMVC